MTQSQLRAPADVAKAPEHAMITESGLASNLISPGTGHEKPSATSTVTVHYTGWKSSDGSMFDSSVIRGQPASFPLNRVIAGWTEGLQLMTVGEKRRFWIPQDLAYGPEVPGSGRPGGQLVFDVELISFEKGPEPLRIPGDAAQTESGIAYVITETGTGDAPANDHMVEFHFTFFDPDGQVVQSSRQAGPQTALMGNLPPFFTELFVRLSPGGKADAYIPGKLLGAAFEFVKCELDLLSIKQTPPPPPVPEDVAAVPSDANKTSSGLAYRRLQSGGTGETPAASSTVIVHYSGWETDGGMFDSSVVRGEPASFPLGQVIPGWTEGLQLMRKGDHFRFWIPQELAYGPKQSGSGRPGGLLVFDVELIDFE